MLPLARPRALLLLLSQLVWGCSEEGAPNTRAGTGAAAGTAAGADAGGSGSGSNSGGGGGEASSPCRPSPPVNPWASWPLPDPEAAGGAAAQRYTLTEEVATDAVTGLQWQRQAAPEPLDWWAASRYCACLTLEEHQDWTLPSRTELVSIVDYTRQNPSLDPQAFPDAPPEWFWSASPTAEAQTRFWYVAFWDGNTHAADLDQRYRARCVRQSAGSTPRYDLSLAGTALDQSTRLTWQRATSAARVTWDAANAACANLDLQGKGWRLPNMKELQTLVDESRATPAIDAEAFPDTPAEGFWAATPLAGSSAAFWFVSFDEGIAYNALQTHPYRYRCVR